jgi:murein DD-endopeptidase MepM/ murein hydrolase activator NlpD
MSQEYRPFDVGATLAHHGNDIMYQRKADGVDQMWPNGFVGSNGNHGTPRWFMPDNIPVCAARDGTLWQVGKGGHGIYVVVDHGTPFATFYTHLSSTPFPDLVHGAGSIKVKRGDKLGIVGFSPSDARRLMHLHFEIWYQGGADSHVDPWPILATAPLPDTKAPGLVS